MESKDSRLTTVPGVKVVKLGFSSTDEKTQIKALLWSPDKAATSPKGVVQITHGMEEHIGRYVDFANYLASHGFVVCGSDMLGHGLSVTSADVLSCIPLERGKEILIQDVHELHKMVASRYSRQTPYFMFGHSLGSYIIRGYIARYGEELAGVILSGTGQQSKLLSRGGNALAHFLARSKGENYRSPFLESMGVGAFEKKIENPRTQFDWLTTDDSVVDDYIADPLCGIPFSVGAYASLTDLTAEVVTAANVAQVPKDLPILFISGALDPVGNKGVGVNKAAESYRQAGVKRVDVKIYEGMRHEILNELNKEDVYTDSTGWLDAVIRER